MFHDILVAYDGSPDAEQALAHAIDLAELSRAKLTLMSAIPRAPEVGLSSQSAGALVELSEALKQETEEDLAAARDRVPDDVSVTTILTADPVRPALLRQLRDGRHDLLVMGSRGRGAIRSALLGSVSQYVLHHTRTAVLIAHADQTAMQEPAPDRGAAAHE